MPQNHSILRQYGEKDTVLRYKVAEESRLLFTEHADACCRSAKERDSDVSSLISMGRKRMLSIQKTQKQMEKELRECPPEQMDVLQEELELEKEKNELISSLLDDWIYEYNIKDHTISTISGRGEGYQFKEGKREERTFLILDGLHPEDERCLIEQSGELSHLAPVHLELRIKRNGEYRWILLTTKSLYGKDGKTVSLLGKITDIDEKKKEELRLLEQANKDSLTGFWNRAAFREKAEEILEKARVKGDVTPALLVVDVDNFRKINEEYGHIYGDTVLVNIAEAMKMVFGEEAVLGRFGSDELTAMVYHTEYGVLEKTIERFREVYTRDMGHSSETYKASCSIGASRYSVDGTTLDEMLKYADSALYYIKKTGRDGYAICTEFIKKQFMDGATEVLSTEPKEEPRKLSDEITEFALDLLEGSKDLSTAMNMLLMKVGKRFRLAAISVREYDDNEMPVISYVWGNGIKRTNPGAEVYVSPEERKGICDNYRVNRMVEIPDIEMLPKEGALYRMYHSKGIQALYQCPFVSEGEVFGYIAYVDNKVRAWTEEEKQSLALIARIIGNYLAREYAYEKIAKKIEEMKSIDEVTGLLKYDKFKEVAQAALNQRDATTKYAVVTTDFVHFKYFNEVYSFRSGDEILRDFADLVAKRNPRSVACCRDYADTFIDLVTINSPESLYRTIETYNEKFIQAQNEKFMDCKLELCTGVYIITDPEEDIMHAMDNANTARKILKEKGETGMLVFEPSMRESRMREIAIQHRLDEAIKNCEFRLYLQPKFSLKSGNLIGAEALSRWVKEDGKIVYPSDFIPALEKSGKIVQLDFYMYEQVLKQQRRWMELGYPLVPISINLSRHHIKDEHLVEKLVHLLEKYEVESRMIEIEITESAFIDDQDALIEVMKKIKKQGFGVSIDDFGTGYSSLSMLTELPADIVKLDKEFLKHSESDITKGMLNNVIRLIKDNRMEVICEGVEEEEQAEFLAKAGCHMGQGFYFSRPIPKDDFETLYFK